MFTNVVVNRPGYRGGPLVLVTGSRGHVQISSPHPPPVDIASPISRAPTHRRPKGTPGLAGRGLWGAEERRFAGRERSELQQLTSRRLFDRSASEGSSARAPQNEHPRKAAGPNWSATASLGGTLPTR